MAEDFFLKRKKAPSIEIDDYSDYKKDEENDLASCGLQPADESTFNERNRLFFQQLKEGLATLEGSNPVPMVSEAIESHFSTREISFLLAKSVIVNMMDQIADSQKK
jgi:hypothetical protein|tara:strand:- start:435 stop:755 length:321 start_codon:yes stop_codon:yes gene_type:complete